VDRETRNAQGRQDYFRTVGTVGTVDTSSLALWARICLSVSGGATIDWWVLLRYVACCILLGLFRFALRRTLGMRSSEIEAFFEGADTIARDGELCAFLILEAGRQSTRKPRREFVKPIHIQQHASVNPHEF
jgi:hypothetical protein